LPSGVVATAYMKSPLPTKAHCCWALST
jgi:hypothetical protein